MKVIDSVCPWGCGKIPGIISGHNAGNPLSTVQGLWKVISKFFQRIFIELLRWAMDYISDSADMDVGKTQSLPTKGLKLREGGERWQQEMEAEVCGCCLWGYEQQAGAHGRRCPTVYAIPVHHLLMSVFSLGHRLPWRHPRSPRFTPKQETKVGWGPVKNAKRDVADFILKSFQICCSH